MVIFGLISGICGIMAFAVLCAQGVLLLKTERHVLFTRDSNRALAMAKRACDERHLAYSELQGTTAGVEVSGRAYKVKSLRKQGERENWLSSIGASRFEIR